MFNPAHPYEPLTSENSALLLVDHQVGFMSGVRHTRSLNSSTTSSPSRQPQRC
jgi:nicotinamidase-related amidase